MKPTVSIIMATYNRAHYITETLLSIQNQTYHPWECLIIDDGGNDNTLQVINPFLKQDQRFQYFKRPNTYKKGLPGCRNFGLTIANGNYIIFFDDDDIVHPLNLEWCVQVLEANQLDFCHFLKKPFYNQIPEFNKISFLEIKLDSFQLNIESVVLQKYGLSSCTVMWKRNCFEQHRFNESLMYAEEWELYSRLFAENFKGSIINEILYYNRKHSNSNTGEFYQNNPIRIGSKKEAIRLVSNNLVQKKLLTPYLIKYLAGLAISFRDINLLNEILTISKTTPKNKLYLKLKFYLFPVWKVYKRVLKKVNK